MSCPRRFVATSDISSERYTGTVSPITLLLFCSRTTHWQNTGMNAAPSPPHRTKLSENDHDIIIHTRQNAERKGQTAAAE